MKSYQVTYALDETGWWVATVPAVLGCHTQGRTLEQAEGRIREALALFVPERAAAQAELVANVKLSATTRRAVLEASSRRKAADALTKRTQAAARAAARALTNDGLSLRDVGTVLGVTRQRAHQLVGTWPPASDTF